MPKIHPSPPPSAAGSIKSARKLAFSKTSGFETRNKQRPLYIFRSPRVWSELWFFIRNKAEEIIFVQFSIVDMLGQCIYYYFLTRPHIFDNFYLPFLIIYNSISLGQNISRVLTRSSSRNVSISFLKCGITIIIIFCNMFLPSWNQYLSKHVQCIQLGAMIKFQNYIYNNIWIYIYLYLTRIYVQICKF